MFATVTFYKLPGAISGHEVPILSPGQDISSYSVAAVDDVKVTRDMLQAVGPMPVFNGYDEVNIAKINDSYYWVVSYSTRTMYEVEQVTFGLVYNAPTTSLRIGGSLTGVFSKTPSQTCPYLSTVISNDAMEMSRSIALPNLGTYKNFDHYDEEKVYWVEVVTTGYGAEHSKIRRIGFFAGYDITTLTPSNQMMAINTSSSQIFPTIQKIISDPESILNGAQADEIVQISISERCPYPYTKHTEYSSYWHETMTWYTLDDVIPVSVAGSSIVAYIEGASGSHWPLALADPDEVEIELTEIERACGSVRMVTESGASIATIPTQYGEDITLDVRTYSDYSGMFTEVSYNGRTLTTMNEGKLPWVGDAWLQYQARQMEMDRTMVSLANEQARADLEISLRQSELNQVMSQINSLSSVNLFSPGSFIGAGLGILEADWKGSEERRAMVAKTGMDTLANETKQRLTEKQMKAEPGTAYSMGYGTIYCYNTTLHPAHIGIETPSNMTTIYYEDFMEQFGYPAEGLQTITLSAGYIQGKLTNDGTVTGPKFDELQRSISDGFLMKAIQ